MAKSSSLNLSGFNKDTQQALRDLKQQLKAAPLSAAAPAGKAVSAPGVNAPEATPDDDQLFAQAMRGVRPIKADETPAPTPARPKKPSAQMLARRAAAVGVDEAGMQGISDTQAMLNPVASEAVLSYRLATLQHRIFEQLKTGKLRWYEAVDLHGCTIEEARSAVLQIIEMARQANENVIKIVHGKGPQAILKTYVNGWLRQHREVLAFVSAPAEQGGTGAVLVLIKRSERQSSDDKAASKAKTR